MVPGHGQIHYLNHLLSLAFIFSDQHVFSLVSHCPRVLTVGTFNGDKKPIHFGGQLFNKIDHFDGSLQLDYLLEWFRSSKNHNLINLIVKSSQIVGLTWVVLTMLALLTSSNILNNIFGLN